jgi:hypothetical protein
MKTKLFPLFAALLLAGCATQKPSPTTHGPVGDISNPEAESPPFIGMTKAQALERYGEPKKHTLTDEGENWVYVLNFGEVMGKALIPFNFKPTPIRTGVLIFGPDGRVKKFNWDKETNG